MEYCVEPSENSRRLARTPIPIREGYADVPEEPKLGVEPDPAIMKKYLVQA
jgi:L-rhamnonate dehydratase